MPIEFTRSWTDPEIELFQDTVVRFIEEKMVPEDDAARHRGDVGHALWSAAGAAGLLCTDIPEDWAAAVATSGTRPSCTRKWRVVA